jgi:nucleotide-binding universal stress UspA family protein
MAMLSLKNDAVPLVSNTFLAGPLRRIAFPTSLSNSSDGALRWAIQITKASDADLLIFHVLPPPTPLFEAEPFEKQEAEIALSRLVAQVNATGVRAKASLLAGTDSIGKQIVRAANLEKIDLLVIGTRDRGRTFRLFISGRVACNVVAHAKCPVLVIPYNPIKIVRPVLHS